jgi:hypothetical protein
MTSSAQNSIAVASFIEDIKDLPPSIIAAVILGYNRRAEVAHAQN